MNSIEPHDPSAPRDPESLLRSRLRTTTREFETRFDDLRRRLAHEPPPRANLASLLAMVMRPRALVAIAATTAAVVAVSLFSTHTKTADAAAFAVTDAESWYVEALALDDPLRSAMVLADADAREAVTWISTESKGGGS